MILFFLPSVVTCVVFPEAISKMYKLFYYGYDLATYFANEFNFTLTDDFELLDKPKKEIEFWSEWT